MNTFDNFDNFNAYTRNELFVLASILFTLIILLLFFEEIKIYIAGYNVIDPRSIMKSIKL
jgi:hypothetical protein